VLPSPSKCPGVVKVGSVGFFVSAFFLSYLALF
jgi:hypothetical protein